MSGRSLIAIRTDGRMRDFQRKQGRERGIENKLGKEGRDRKQTREGREGEIEN